MDTDTKTITSLENALPILDKVHDRFVRMFRITLSGALRKQVDVVVRSTDFISFGEYLQEMSAPTSLNLAKLAPLNGTAIVNLDSKLIYTLIDIFYGGTGENIILQGGRDYTPIEQRLIKRVVISALEDLQTAWKIYMKLNVSYQRTEINPRFVAIVPQSDIVMVTRFDVIIDDEPLHMNFCLPFAMLQPFLFYIRIKNRLNASTTFRNITGMLGIGYKLTPLPNIVEKIKPTISQPPPVPALKPDTPGDTLRFLASEPKMTAAFIGNEYPQTIALILAHFDNAEQMAKIFNELPENIKPDVAYRIATIESIPPGVMNEIEAVLAKEIKAAGASSATKLGGIKSTAEMLNSLPIATETRILKTIQKSNATLAENIRRLMFTFEDLVLIDQSGIQAILKEISKDDLILALSDRTDTVKEHIFNSMTDQAAKTAGKNLKALGSVPSSDVDNAQAMIVRLARRMVEEGRVKLVEPSSVPDEKKGKKTTPKKGK